ncbi:alpha/beta hydrolase [Variovorax rhizosphaerae]|uniref:Alpha/beta hydrolase n=1 Tax=Variovorax rhizosphaerae TaxID=1836200 RepID=A0ABU8WT94_9BURK
MNLSIPTTRNARERRIYVLVHGAWFGASVWRPVADALRATGQTVYTPSLTGLGDRRHLLRPGINLDTHADDVLNLILQEDLAQVVLVGWSYGGMVISDVLARIPERIASMVYLDAFAPERGKAQMNYANRNGSYEAMVQLAVQGLDVPPMSLEALAVADPAVIEYAASRVSPHPVMTMLQASKALPERPAGIHHTYVLAGGYTHLSSTFVPFHRMFQDDERATALILDTSHVMMLTDPRGTFEILADAA